MEPDTTPEKNEEPTLQLGTQLLDELAAQGAASAEDTGVPKLGEDAAPSPSALLGALSTSATTGTEAPDSDDVPIKEPLNFFGPVVPGRVVHLHKISVGEDLERVDDVYAGIICEVHSREIVNIAAFEKNGTPFSQLSVYHKSANGAGTVFWCFPQES